MPKPTQKTARILDTPYLFATLSQRNAKKNPTIEQHEFQQCHNSSLPRASKTPKINQKTQILYQTALINPSHNAKESISFFIVLHTIFNVLLTSIYTNQKTTTWEHLLA